MSRKIKFHTFHFLFSLFAYLADKSGGWRVFVRPKLLLGSLIVGLGLISSGFAQISNQNKAKQKTRQRIQTKKIAKGDSIRAKDDSVVYATENMITDIKGSCYETIEPIQLNRIYQIVEQMPQFPGGEKELIKFISNNIIYPDKAKDDKIEGKVICRFLVNKDGSISDIQVIRSLNSLLDAEAVRVLKLLPNFNPGMQDNNPVRVWYTLPVVFKLKNDVRKN